MATWTAVQTVDFRAVVQGVGGRELTEAGTTDGSGGGW